MKLTRRAFVATGGACAVALSPVALAAGRLLRGAREVWQLPSATDDGNWYTPVPVNANYPTLAYNAATQPGSRFHYISETGSDTFTAGNASGSGFDFYMMNAAGTAIVDSLGNTTGFNGQAYGTDPRNPNLTAIKPARTWAMVWQRYSGGAIGSNERMGLTRPDDTGRNNYSDWWLFKRGDSFDINGDLQTYLNATGNNISNQRSSIGLNLAGTTNTVNRQVVCDYGPTSSQRPRFHNPTALGFMSRGWVSGDPLCQNVAYLGLWFDGATKTDQMTITGTIGAGNVLTATPKYTENGTQTYLWWRKRKAGTIPIGLTLSGTSGTVTATAASAVFHASDADSTANQGRYLVVGSGTTSGRMHITGFTSTTVVTGSVETILPGTSISADGWEIYDANDCTAATDNRAIAGEVASTYTQVAGDDVFDLKCAGQNPQNYTGFAFSTQFGVSNCVNVLIEDCWLDECALGVYLNYQGGVTIRRNLITDCTQSGGYFSGEPGADNRYLIENWIVRNGVEHNGFIKTLGIGTAKTPFMILNRNLYFGGQTGEETHIYGNGFVGGASGLQLRAGGKTRGNYILENYAWWGGGDYGGVGYYDRSSTGFARYNVMELHKQVGAGSAASTGVFGLQTGTKGFRATDNIISNPNGDTPPHGFWLHHGSYSANGDLSFHANTDNAFARNIMSLGATTNALAVVKTLQGSPITMLTATTISIDATAKTITRTSGDWHQSGFSVEAGGTVVITGAGESANNTTYHLSATSQLVLTWDTSTGTPVTEAAGANITIKRQSPWVTPSMANHEVSSNVVVINSGVIATGLTNTANATWDATYGRVPASDTATGITESGNDVYSSFATAATAKGWLDSSPRTLKRFMVEVMGETVSSVTGIDELVTKITASSTGMRRGQWNPRWAPTTPLGWVAAGYRRTIPSDLSAVTAG